MKSGLSDRSGSYRHSLEIRYRYQSSEHSKEGAIQARNQILELLLQRYLHRIYGHGIATDYNNILVTRHEIVSAAGLRFQVRYWDLEERRPGLAFIVTIKVAQRIEMRDSQDYWKPILMMRLPTILKRMQSLLSISSWQRAQMLPRTSSRLGAIDSIHTPLASQ